MIIPTIKFPLKFSRISIIPTKRTKDLFITPELKTTPELGKPVEPTFEDFLKELPSGIGKVFGTIGNLVLDIALRFPARATASITLGVFEEIKPGQTFVYQPEGLVDKIFFGSEEVKSVQKRAEEVKSWARKYNIPDAEIGGVSLLSVAGIAALTGIDLAPFGGSAKNLGKALLKTKTAEGAMNILRKTKVPEDLIQIYAPRFAKETTQKGVEKGLKGLGEILKTSKFAPEIRPVSKKSAVELRQRIKELEAMKIKQPIMKEDIEGAIGRLQEKISAIKAKPLIKPIPKELEPLAVRTEKVSDVARKDLENWIIKKKPMQTSSIEEISALKIVPEGNVMLYRAGDVSRTTPTSWSYNKEQAEYFARFNKQKVISKTFSPNEIVIDTTKIPKDTTLGHTPNIFKHEQEVIVKATEAVKEVKEVAKITPEMEAILKLPPQLPVVVRGETFVLGETGKVVSATEKEMRVALIAEQKAIELGIKQQKLREKAIESIGREHGKTENIITRLKNKGLLDEDIDNMILEEGTKLRDTLKIKRNSDRSLAAVIKKSEIEDLAKSYTEELPKAKWGRRTILIDGVETTKKITGTIELPYVWFEKKGLSALYDPIIQAGRDAEVLKTGWINRFKEAGLFKEGSWFTADRFILSGKESNNIAKYYLTRQGKIYTGYTKYYKNLSTKEKKFVDIFDEILRETEPKFYNVARKAGKNPGIVENYAPLMVKGDLGLADKMGRMQWIYRKHPAFFSLKERMEKVPGDMYNLDYRKVAVAWLEGMADFLHYGEATPKLKYLTNSDEFKAIIKESDWGIINTWLREITTPPVSPPVVPTVRKLTAIGTLGLNYASVLKQALTQIPIMIIEKARPKMQSRFAKAFGINVAELPSITSRKGALAIADLQGKVGRIFTGSLTKFDKKNAQWSLNGLLDKYGANLWKQMEKNGKPVSQEAINLVVKRAQDALDMWYGGFMKGQIPWAFRREVGRTILMFLYPLTSQLNGFYRHILQAKGIENWKAAAEVATAITAIAYSEQVIENLSLKWSDEVGMMKDVALAAAGNIPLVSTLAYSIMSERDVHISPILSNVSMALTKINRDPERALWYSAQILGVPAQMRKIRYGMEIMEKGGITDENDKMLAPVSDTMELVRSFLRGKYGSIASQDWVRNIGEKKEDRRWFVPEVEFLQNGDYDRKAELYKQFDKPTQDELFQFLSEEQQRRLRAALAKFPTTTALKISPEGIPTIKFPETP